MKYIILIALLIGFTSSYGQTNFKFKTTGENQIKSVPYHMVEQKPLFKDAKSPSSNYLMLKAYLQEKTKQNFKNGDIIIPVYFIIDKNGYSKVQQVIYDETDPLTNAATIVVEDMPTWTPGKHKGETVNVSYSLNLVF